MLHAKIRAPKFGEPAVDWADESLETGQSEIGSRISKSGFALVTIPIQQINPRVEVSQ